MSEVIDIDIELSEPQAAVLETSKALILQMAGQGSGKSAIIGLSSGLFISYMPQVKGFIGANTHMQLSQSTLNAVFKVWKEKFGFEEYDQKARPAGAYVIDKRPPAHFVRYHTLKDYSGTISFFNGCLIFTGSLENYKAHDGKEFGWAHLDETKDTNKNALTDVILGRLRQLGVWRNPETCEVHFDPFLPHDEARARGLIGWNPLYIHTSPDPETDVKWLTEMFGLRKYEKQIKERVLMEESGYFHAEFGNKAVIIYSTHHNKKNLPPDYIDNQKSSMMYEEKIMKLVYGFPFGKSGCLWFPYFRRDQCVKKVLYEPGGSVHQAWDFNVIPYMTMLAAQIRYVTRYIDPTGVKYDEPAPGLRAIDVMQIRFYKEYCLEEPLNTTEAVCEAFAQDHAGTGAEGNCFYYGDASGLHRIPGMGSVSNFKIIAENLYLFFHNDSKRVRDPNVGVFTRRDLCNKIFSGKIPSIEIEIDEENCPNLISDLENVKLGPKGKVKEEEKDPITQKKFQKNGHTSDAFEYIVSEVCRAFITT